MRVVLSRPLLLVLPVISALALSVGCGEDVLQAPDVDPGNGDEEGATSGDQLFIPVGGKFFHIYIDNSAQFDIFGFATGIAGTSNWVISRIDYHITRPDTASVVFFDGFLTEMLTAKYRLPANAPVDGTINLTYPIEGAGNGGGLSVAIGQGTFSQVNYVTLEADSVSYATLFGYAY